MSSLSQSMGGRACSKLQLYGTSNLKLAGCVEQVRSSDEQAIKQMQDFKTGLSGALSTALETDSRQGATSPGSGKSERHLRFEIFSCDSGNCIVVGLWR